MTDNLTLGNPPTKHDVDPNVPKDFLEIDLMRSGLMSLSREDWKVKMQSLKDRLQKVRKRIWENL